MSDTLILNAKKREELGKKANRIRKSGKCPAVLYGFNKEPVALALEPTEFVKLYEKAGSSTLIDVVIDGGIPEKAIIGEIQVHPVTDRLQHVDLQRVDMMSEISADIRLSFVGESMAVKVGNGILQTQLDSIEATCLPGDLVSEIKVDISKLKTFNDSIHVKDIVVPAGITIDTDSELLVVSVNPPRSEKELAELDSDVVEDVSRIEGVKKESDNKNADNETKEGKGK